MMVLCDNRMNELNKNEFKVIIKLVSLPALRNILFCCG